MSVARWLPLASIWIASAASAELPAALPGWVIEPTGRHYAELVERVDAAVAASPLNVVTRASATVGAKSLGQDIPGNMVVGVFAPQFAIRLLDASVAAGIEAPLRLYITEKPRRFGDTQLQDRRACAGALCGRRWSGPYGTGDGARYHPRADCRAGDR